MTDENVESDDDIDNVQTLSVSRRQVLQSSLATAGALAFAGGTVGSVAASQETGRFNDAPGRGGEAVVPEDDYKDKTFTFTGRTGDTAKDIDGVIFECNAGDGKPIFLVGWNFVYVDEDTERTLYTRSNNIDTSLEYNWSDSGAKLCDDSGLTVTGDGNIEDFIQTPYRATGQQ